ncbi:NADH:ubiquinone oxidoreductase subunit NDUFA12 [Segnochrobactraceae bacterium EtOH-i3]
MRALLLELFTWWNSETMGTRLFTKRHGELVGTDQFGNKYYRTKGGAKDPTVGFQRRWVIYNGEAEASAIPPGWHGWIHHKVDTPPTEENYKPHPWEIEHRSNPTGTPLAYRPQGSLLRDGQRPKVTGDYDAWTPGA